jgi:hypothetical protein
MVPLEIDFKKKLLEIEKKGFIKSLKKSDTGVGYTLELLLGVPENNLQDPDFVYKGNPVELKTQREQATSNITLFTKEPCWQPYRDADLLNRYGYEDVDKRFGLKVTLTTRGFNPQQLKIEITNDKLNILHAKDGVVCFYNLQELMEKVQKKLSSRLLLVFADSKKKGKTEYFHYNKAYLLSELSENGFRDLLSEGKLVVEFRMHLRENGSVRNHGTGFRLNERYLMRLYKNKEQILE